MKPYVSFKIVAAEQADVNGVQGYNVTYPEMYEKHLRKDTFETLYVPTKELSFGLAFECLKRGMFIARSSWAAFSPRKNSYLQIINNKDYGDNIIRLCDKQLTSHIPWASSTEEMLANDWYVLEQ